MGFQQGPINQTNMGQGIPGEKAYDGPSRCFPWTLVSTPQLNIVGATAYTEVSEGVAMAGGTGTFAGILVDPKAYAAFNYGGPEGALLPTMQLPDGTIGQLMTMGIYFVVLVTAGNIGDQVIYNTTTGVLDRVAFGGSPGTGNAAVPNARIILRASAANGLAIVQLTN
jgi:hypothetical protein